METESHWQKHAHTKRPWHVHLKRDFLSSAWLHDFAKHVIVFSRDICFCYDPIAKLHATSNNFTSAYQQNTMSLHTHQEDSQDSSDALVRGRPVMPTMELSWLQGFIKMGSVHTMLPSVPKITSDVDGAPYVWCFYNMFCGLDTWWLQMASKDSENPSLKRKLPKLLRQFQVIILSTSWVILPSKICVCGLENIDHILTACIGSSSKDGGS